MDKHKKHLLWSVAALSLGLMSVPPSAASIPAEGERAIDRLPEIRALLRGALEEGTEPMTPSGLSRLAQDWPNWTNWGNG